LRQSRWVSSLTAFLIDNGKLIMKNALLNYFLKIIHYPFFICFMNLTNWELIKNNRNFRNLLVGQYVSELGNWFNFIAGQGIVRSVTGGAVEPLMIFLICRTLPWALLMPFAGTLADRISRWKLMMITDIIRIFLALSFIFVRSAEDLWIIYLGSVLMSVSSSLFDGAKSAVTPNLVGNEGLLAGTALMFSSRFLLMAVGNALGGIAVTFLGYEVAFIINSLSFLVSAYSIWLIPQEATEQAETRNREKETFFSEMWEGFRFAVRHPFVLTIILMNLIWAVGGGAIQIILERLGGDIYAPRENLSSDFAIGMLWAANGLGLAVGMLIAHRIGGWIEIRNWTSGFIGWSLILQGILFAIAGSMPVLWLAALVFFISRIVIGVEYAVQETLFQQALPDYIRGRISTLDRGLEITVFSVSIYLAGISLSVITPQMLTIASGILTAFAALIWFARAESYRKLQEVAESCR
jgi:MFS family permease